MQGYGVYPLMKLQNGFIWRQQDCVKNAVQMVAQSEMQRLKV